MRAVLLLLGALAVPLTLIWDFSWESTIGVDSFLGPPHAANYAAVALACAAALRMAQVATRDGSGIALGPVRAPLGAWLALWGGLALVAALLFDRWWQASYGLAAGIWHPPQIAKALAYFALVAGAWVHVLGRQHDTRGALAAALACGALLTLIAVVTLPQSFANRQHSGALLRAHLQRVPAGARGPGGGGTAAPAGDGGGARLPAAVGRGGVGPAADSRLAAGGAGVQPARPPAAAAVPAACSSCPRSRSTRC